MRTCEWRATQGLPCQKYHNLVLIDVSAFVVGDTINGFFEGSATHTFS